MRIAHIESSMNWGGQELRVIEQSEWLIGSGHQVHIIARPGSAIFQEAENRGLPTLALEMRGSVHPGTIWKLFRYIRQNNIEILDAHSNRDASYAMFAKWLTSVAVVRSRHVTNTIKLGGMREMVWRKGCHRYSVTADKIRQQIVELGLATRNKIDVIPPGVDEQRFSPEYDKATLKTKYGIPPDAFVVANIGMIRQDKGLLYFVEACEVIADKLGKDNVRFIHVGEATASTQSYKAEVQKRLGELSCASAFEFMGYHTDIENYIALADVIVVASIGTEAQTRLISQAFLMKKAVVATTTGGLPEMILNNETGLLVEPANPEAIATAVLALADSPSFMDSIREGAYQYALKHFTFAVMMQQMLQTYTDTLSAKNS